MREDGEVGWGFVTRTSLGYTADGNILAVRQRYSQQMRDCTKCRVE